MTDITYPTLHATHFDYDAGGRKIDMTDATGTTTWDYKADGVHLDQLASPGGTLTYVYDGDGRLGYKYLNLNNVFTYWYNTYDPAGRLTQLRSTLDGTTTFAYDAANRLTQKTKGSGQYELYAYDNADQMTSIGYWWADGTGQNALTYSYTPGGSVQTMNQGYYNTTYAYDGANQLTSETNSGTYPPPNRGFTYDHNGNRLTQNINGSPAQAFTYDGHDKLTSGVAGNETDTYDLNGSETSISLGGSLYRFTYDDEDRLVTGTYPGATDTFTYNGLGLRVGKTDSTGTYSYFCDGASPGSPVLSDGHAVYTPGLSENRAGVSTYAASDVLGNLGFMDGAGSGTPQTYYQDTTAFGSGAGMGLGGTEAGPFKFGGANGCQTDTDINFVLMGHRYYDSRQGRFISQDPAGSGNNWYAYADNDPVDNTDPSGLMIEDGPGSSPLGSPGYMNISGGALARGEYEQNFNSFLKEAEARQSFYVAPPKRLAEGANVPTFLYRGGGRNPSSLTPRPGTDTVGEQRGLSAYDTVEGAAKAANKPGGPYQTISTDNLTSLDVVQTGPDGHYSIRPDTQAELDQWAATKGTSPESPYTTEVKSALVGSPGIFPDTPCPICP